MFMRYLFYIPLASTHRCEILSNLLLTLLKAEDDIVIVCERKIAFRFAMDKEIHIHENEYRIEQIFDQRLTPFIQYCDCFFGDNEKALMKSDNKRYENLKLLLSGQQFDKIVLWGGGFNYDHATVRAISDCNLSNQMLFMEVGWFSQKEYVYFDESGVNRRSSISGTNFRPLTPFQKTCLDAWRDRYISKNLGSTSSEHNKRIIFVPLQVDTDTSILEGSPFPDMRTFVSYLERWIPDEFEVIFKIHPKSHYTYLLGSTRANFTFLASGSIGNYLRDSEFVLGINSTVLLEALALGKKVIAFGEGIFSDCKVLTEAKIEDRALDVIGNYTEGKNIDSFLYHLVFERQVSIEELSLNNVAHLYSRHPFNQFPCAARVGKDILISNANEGKSMIKIGKSKVAKTAYLDVEKGGSIEIGDDSEIRHHAVLETTGRYNGSIRIGNHSVIGVGNWLQGSGEIFIGDDVIIGPYTVIVSTNHKYEDCETPVAQQPLETGKVHIANDVWIGAHVTIAHNVSIGAHSIIGANSFVNADIPAYSVVVGSPAKVVRKRK